MITDISLRLFAVTSSQIVIGRVLYYSANDHEHSDKNMYTYFYVCLALVNGRKLLLNRYNIFTNNSTIGDVTI